MGKRVRPPRAHLVRATITRSGSNDVVNTTLVTSSPFSTKMMAYNEVEVANPQLVERRERNDMEACRGSARARARRAMADGG